MTHLLVGLGNVGEKYLNTRHNFGFLVLDRIIIDHRLDQLFQNKFHAEGFKGEIAGTKIIAIKPQTFMNVSGLAVAAVCNFYKIPPEQVIVLHDDIDLPLGKIRVRAKEGNFSHNGLRSIDEAIGKNYYKLRLGVGRPEIQPVADYVLQNFSSEEMLNVKLVAKKISQLIQFLILKEADKFMNQFNQI